MAKGLGSNKDIIFVFVSEILKLLTLKGTIHLIHILFIINKLLFLVRLPDYHHKHEWVYIE